MRGSLQSDSLVASDVFLSLETEGAPGTHSHFLRMPCRKHSFQDQGICTCRSPRACRWEGAHRQMGPCCGVGDMGGSLGTGQGMLQAPASPAQQRCERGNADLEFSSKLGGGGESLESFGIVTGGALGRRSPGPRPQE